MFIVRRLHELFWALWVTDAQLGIVRPWLSRTVRWFHDFRSKHDEWYEGYKLYHKSDWDKMYNRKDWDE